MTDTTKNVKTLLLTQAQALRASADVLEAQAAALEGPDGRASDFLTAKQCLEAYGLGHDGLLNASKKGLQLVRGSRNQVRVERAELERYLRTRSVTPRKAAPAADLGDWDAQAERSLRQSTKGGRH